MLSRSRSSSYAEICCQSSTAGGSVGHSSIQHVLCRLGPALLANAAAACCLWTVAADAADIGSLPAAARQVTQASTILQRSWSPCTPKTSCVSTNSIMSPSQYMPPWLFGPDSKETAFTSVLEQLQELNAVIIEADEAVGYIDAQVPTGSNKNFDSLQLQLQPDGVVLFKSQANVNKPDPPFCLRPGCISGPSNRGRLDALRDALGWTILETDEDKQWVQILLH